MVELVHLCFRGHVVRLPQGNVELVVRSDAADPQVMSLDLILAGMGLSCATMTLAVMDGLFRLGAGKSQNLIDLGDIESSVLGETDTTGQLLWN